jgi:hypothetical protein
MNWLNEAQTSSRWLNWVRQITGFEGIEPGSSLRQVVDGVERWNAEIDANPRATGDPDRVSPGEYFSWAAAMMSRTTRHVIDQALEPAVEWAVDDPENWPNIDLAQARLHWHDSHYVIVNVTAAWAQLWQDRAAHHGTMSGSSNEDILAKWGALANQASETIEGLAVAFWAGCRRD